MITQNVGNTHYLRVVGMNLNNCSNIKVLIRQEDFEIQLDGTVSTSYGSDVLGFSISKENALKLKNATAKIQVVLTTSGGEVATHKPILFRVNELLRSEGYGN